jgi:hypothetical protein
MTSGYILVRKSEQKKQFWRCKGIIIIIGKPTLLRRFCQVCLLPAMCRKSDHPVFTCLDFVTIFFLQSKVVSLASNPQPGGPGLCIYVPQLQGGPVIPQASGSLFIAFYDSQGYGGGILTSLHSGGRGLREDNIKADFKELRV